MALVLFIITILLLLLIGIFIFNYKFKLSTLHISYIIIGLVVLSILLLILFYNAHPECDLIVNRNNYTLKMLQDKCYQYINF